MVKVPRDKASDEKWAGKTRRFKLDESLQCEAGEDDTRRDLERMSDWVTVREATTCTHESRRTGGLTPKPRIWNGGAEAVSLKSYPTFRLTGSERTPNPPSLSPLNIYWCRPGTQTLNPTGPRYGEDLGY